MSGWNLTALYFEDTSTHAAALSHAPCAQNLPQITLFPACFRDNDCFGAYNITCLALTYCGRNVLVAHTPALWNQLHSTNTLGFSLLCLLIAGQVIHTIFTYAWRSSQSWSKSPNPERLCYCRRLGKAHKLNSIIFIVSAFSGGYTPLSLQVTRVASGDSSFQDVTLHVAPL